MCCLVMESFHSIMTFKCVLPTGVNLRMGFLHVLLLKFPCMLTCKRCSSRIIWWWKQTKHFFLNTTYKAVALNKKTTVNKSQCFSVNWWLAWWPYWMTDSILCIFGIKLYFYGNNFYCFCHPTSPPYKPPTPEHVQPLAFETESANGKNPKLIIQYLVPLGVNIRHPTQTLFGLSRTALRIVCNFSKKEENV